MTAHRSLPILILVALAALLLNAVAVAHDDHDDDDEGHHATPTVSPMAMSTGAAYLTIRNDGDEDDRLIAATTDVAQVVEIHEVVDDDGVKKMRPLPDGLEIDDGETVALTPGGYHLMLIGLKQDLTAGMTFDLTLTFEEAGEVVVPVTVQMTAEMAAATPTPPVTAGDLTITGAWARPAPAMETSHDRDREHDDHDGKVTPTATR